jgi:hypothetical protein
MLVGGTIGCKRDVKVKFGDNRNAEGSDEQLDDAFLSAEREEILHGIIRAAAGGGSSSSSGGSGRYHEHHPDKRVDMDRLLWLWRLLWFLLFGAHGRGTDPGAPDLRDANPRLAAWWIDGLGGGRRGRLRVHMVSGDRVFFFLLACFWVASRGVAKTSSSSSSEAEGEAARPLSPSKK